MTNFYYLNSPDPVVIGSDSLEFKALYQPPGSSARAYYPITAAEVAAGLIVSAGVAGQVADTTFEPGDVRRYGAVAGEAATVTSSVNTAAIQAALDSNGYVWLQPGATYMANTVHIWSDTTFDLNGGTLMLCKDANDLMGSIVVAPAAWGISTVPQYYDADREIATDNVVIKNGTLDGNLVNNLAPTPGDYGNWTSAVHLVNGILIRGLASNVTVQNMSIHHYQTDGILTFLMNNGGVQETPFGLKCIDVDFGYNGRQGFSNSGGSYQDFTRCKFHHTGIPYDHELHPQGPFAGVDIESEGQLVEHIYFTDCDFYENHSWGMIFSYGGDYTDIRIDNCRFKDNQWREHGANTAYLVDDRVINKGILYVCTVAGTTAASPSLGPTHTVGSAVDGTVTWAVTTLTPKPGLQLEFAGNQNITNAVVSNSRIAGLLQLIKVNRDYWSSAPGVLEVIFNSCDIGSGVDGETLTALFVNTLTRGSRVTFNSCIFKHTENRTYTGGLAFEQYLHGTEIYFNNCDVTDMSAAGTGNNMWIPSITDCKIHINGGHWRAGSAASAKNILGSAPGIQLSIGGGAVFEGAGDYHIYSHINNTAMQSAGISLSSGEAGGVDVMRVADTSYWEAGHIMGILLDTGDTFYSKVISIVTDVSVTIEVGLPSPAAAANATYWFKRGCTQLNAGVGSGINILPVDDTTLFKVGGGAMVYLDDFTTHSAEIASISPGVSITIDGAGLASPAADNSAVYPGTDNFIRLGDCLMLDAARSVYVGPLSRMNGRKLQISAGANLEGIALAPQFITDISHITCSGSPNTVINAGKGSIAQSDDGNVYRNTDGATAWTAM